MNYEIDPYEKIYITTHYACGCVGCTGVLRMSLPEDYPHEVSSPLRCRVHSQDIEHNPDRRVERAKK